MILTGRGRIRRIAAAADRGRPRARDADRGDQRRQPRRAAHPARHPVRPPGPAAAARHVRGRRRRRAGAHVHIPDGFLTGEAAALGTAHRRGGRRRVPARRGADVRGRRTCPWRAWRRRSSSSARRRSSRSRSARNAHLLGGALAVALLGPYLGALTITTCLHLQALRVRHGGITTLGHDDHVPRARAGVRRLPDPARAAQTVAAARRRRAHRRGLRAARPRCSSPRS